MSIKIDDIARIVGVNKSTVSRSLNDSPLVSEKTKAKIKKIAREFDFEFNSNARILNTKRTETIGIIYPEEIEDFNVSLYHSSLLSDIRSVFEKEGYDTLITFPRNRYSGRSNIKKLIGAKKVDGLLIICPDIVQQDWEYIRNTGFPVIFLHYKPNLNIIDEVSFISSDNFTGGRMSAEYLVKLGHRKILCLNDLDTNMEYSERMEGYKDYFKSAGIKINNKYILNGRASGDFGYRLILDNVELLKEVTAVSVLGSDLMAMGTLKALFELGYKVPDDISVIGYDDSPVGNYTIPELTTIHQPREAISKLAVSELIKMSKRKLEKSKKLPVEKHFKKLVKPKIVVRKSCKKLNYA